VGGGEVRVKLRSQPRQKKTERSLRRGLRGVEGKGLADICVGTKKGRVSLYDGNTLLFLGGEVKVGVRCAGELVTCFPAPDVIIAL